MAKREASLLTDAQLRGWLRADVPVAKSDGGGLTFTLSAAGTAAWIFQSRSTTSPVLCQSAATYNCGSSSGRALAPIFQCPTAAWRMFSGMVATAASSASLRSSFVSAFN